MDVTTTQRRRCHAGIPIKIFSNCNAFMMQLGTSCSFDSPGLAGNEPTPGEHPQGDSTPLVLSFFCEGMGIARGLMSDCA